MDVEEFKKKYEQLKDNPMYKNFCSILDTKNQVLERMSKENQELKKQLHESSLEIQHLIEQDIECPSNCDKLKELNKSLEASRRVAKYHLNRELDLENQQKEFIEWLEKEIQEQEDYAVSLGLTIDYGIAEYTSGKIDALKESLSKYKEIVGGNNDQ